MRYAFTFDASACTGCKSCQVACKDKNALPAGVLWRRVYEVSGGGWQRHGAAWTNTVFAYNVSVGCNHCDNPACVSACPTNAYSVRSDGIVVQDRTRCIGCEYCAWACPYSAPQYSRELGRTTKCDFCCDLLDQGLPPACVASCPMRALDYRQLADEQPIAATQPFPLPAVSRSKPSVAIKPHPAMLNALPKAVRNREEVRPMASSQRARLAELPLVAFTLFGQAAAGIAVLSLLSGVASSALHVAIGVLIAAAALISLLHLGTIAQVWRAPAAMNTSRLSREIVMLVLFGLSWVVAFRAPQVGQFAMAACGLGLIYSMAEVYRIDSVPGWNTWRTHASFVVAGLVLGSAALALVSTALTWPILLVAATLAVVAVVWRARFYERIHAKSM